MTRRVPGSDVTGDIIIHPPFKGPTANYIGLRQKNLTFLKKLVVDNLIVLRISDRNSTELEVLVMKLAAFYPCLA